MVENIQSQSSLPTHAKPSFVVDSGTHWMKPIIIMLTISVGIVGGVLIWLLFFGGNKNKTVQQVQQTLGGAEVSPVLHNDVVVSGTIAFEGYAPDEAYLVIVEKTAGKNDFKSVVTGLEPKNGSIPWIWKDATHSTNYELRAQLKIRGKTVQESASVNVSAPADNVLLSLISEQDPPVAQKVSITGNVHLDGYIPAGSSLSILSRPTGGGDYTSVIVGLPAQNNIGWNWNNAMSGNTYDLSVQLKNAAGAVISSDPDKTITAPSSGVLFDISSTAQPPAPVVTGISGTININGTIPSNSYVTLAQRKTGSASFTEIKTIPATDGVSWSWSEAQTGTQYDIQSYLWVDKKPYAQSNMLSLTAPSTNNLMTINAQQSLSAPSANTINVACNGQQNNNFQGVITYNTNAGIQNAQQYRVVVTNASTGNQVVNTVTTPSYSNQSQSMSTGYQFSSGTTYYAQYAYSTNGGTFSPLSPSLQFSCR